MYPRNASYFLASDMLFRFQVLLTGFLLIGFSHAAFAQEVTQGTVSGVVTEADTDDPLVSATVALHAESDDSVVTGTMTGEDGTFELENIPEGEYYVRVSFVGYEAEEVSDVVISAEQQEVDVGEIILQTDAAELEGIEVAGEREYMEVGVDRTVYHTQNQPVTAGGSAQDVLENIPSIEVDLDGNISMRGSQGVQVHLNGRPAPMSGEALVSFLEGLSAEDIERVEVIPNPSARYEPEGTSGILNIELARDRDIGWGGSVSSRVDTRGRYGGSVNTHYGSGPWNVHANYSLRYGERDRGGWRHRENRYLEPRTFLEQESERHRQQLSNNINTSIDYEFDESNTLSFRAILSHRGRDNDRLNRYSELDADQNLTHVYSRATDGERTDFGMDYRLTFEHVITPRAHELSLEARYQHDRRSEFDQYVEHLLPLDNPNGEGILDEQQHVDDNRYGRDFSFRADYVRPIGELAQLEVGYQGDLEWLDNSFYSESLSDSDGFTPDTHLNNTYLYTEQLHSAYGILGGNVGDFGVQLGLRAERMLTNFDLQTTGEVFENSYFSFFPSAHFSYEITEHNTVRASYSKRVRRPRQRQLNPFADYDDPTFLRVGNPYLTPQYTHSAELSYSRLGEEYTITLSPYVRYTVDEISWHEDLTDDGVSIRTFENFDSRVSYGTELVTSFTVSDWLQSRASFNAYRQVTEAGDLASELSGGALGFRSRVSVTANLISGFNLQLSQFYRSPMDVPGGRIAAWNRTDLALQKDVLGGRGRLNLGIRDIFDATDNLIQRDMERYYLEYFRDRNSRSVRLSFRYTFSSGDSEGGGGRGGRGGPGR